MMLYVGKSDEDKNMCKLLEALSVQLLDYLEKPSQEHQVEVLLKNLCRDLKFIDDFSFYLQEGYLFNTRNKILYNEKNKEIKLTKNEIKFMEIMSSRKEQYYSSDFIEYSIWEEDSVHEDCNKRLKYLIYGLRKKLPKNAIVNSYSLGYKLVSTI
jgi:DNA-binding response OmpR family regulator